MKLSIHVQRQSYRLKAFVVVKKTFLDFTDSSFIKETISLAFNLEYLMQNESFKSIEMHMKNL